MIDKTNPLSYMSKEEVLYELLKKEYGYYSSIREITKQENEKLARHDPLSEINPLLKQKKILLSCITEIESSMQPLKKYWREKQERNDPVSLKIKKQLAEMDHLLKDILQLDLISQKSLEEHLLYLQNQNQPSDKKAK